MGGICCLYAGTLLYKDELGRAQNRLEEWWVRFNEQQKVALSKAALFMRATVTLTGRLLDGLFGEKLVSFQSLTVSACFSMASFLAVSSLADFFSTQASIRREDPIVTCGTVLFFLLGTLSSRFRWARVLAVGAFMLILYYLFGLWLVLFIVDFFIKSFTHNYFAHNYASRLAAVVVAGLLSPILFVMLTRCLLCWSERFKLAVACLVVLLGDAALGVLLFAAPLTADLVFDVHSKWIGWFEAVGIANAFSFLLSLFVALVALLLLLHRMFWPTVARLLYVVAPSKTQKVLLVLVGTGLLTFALGKPISEGAKEFVKTLASGA